jgi:hypothetical protein
MDRLKRSGAQAAAPTGNVPYINKKDVGNWAYLMITIRPDLLSQIAAKLVDLTKSVDVLRKDVDAIQAK